VLPFCYFTAKQNISNMFSAQTYINRRAGLQSSVKSGLILLTGNGLSPMNYTDNTYRFRQDSNFLYYMGINQPGMMALIDCDKGESILLGKEPTIDDFIWTGPLATLATLGEKVGVEKVLPIDQIGSLLGAAVNSGREVHYLPPYRAENVIKIHRWLGLSLDDAKEGYSIPLIRAVVAQREIKSEEEIAAMEKALEITAEMHLTAMQTAKPGMVEAEVTGKVHGVAVGHGGGLAYPIILTVDGHNLHNHRHHNVLEAGQLLLGDFGAETAEVYSGDITRTFPVAKQFTTQQREIYELVLEAQLAAIEASKPGTTFKSIHLLAATIMAKGLKELGIMKGDLGSAVEEGAHALFFPHGLGHSIGIDVHDMEDLGEAYVGYDKDTVRSKQFGLRSLRFGKALRPGHVMTVEPGLYFIPELIDLWSAEGKFKEYINYDALEAYRHFGGVRIEDDILITKSGNRLIGPAIPKAVAEVEAIRSAAY
jgi:Xaa-Pro aminopeptidase